MLGGVIGGLNAGVALLLGWWFGRQPAEFGWYSYSPMPRRYATYGSAHTIRPAWQIVIVVAVFFIVNIAVAAVALHMRRRAAGAES